MPTSITTILPASVSVPAVKRSPGRPKKVLNPEEQAAKEAAAAEKAAAKAAKEAAKAAKEAAKAASPQRSPGRPKKVLTPEEQAAKEAKAAAKAAKAAKKAPTSEVQLTSDAAIIADLRAQLAAKDALIQKMRDLLA